MEDMKMDGETIDLTKVIEELDSVDYTTLAEKAEKQLEIFFTTFSEQYDTNAEGDNIANETKKDMIRVTYNTSIQVLNTGLNYLEYAYLLSLSIKKMLEKYDLTFNETQEKAMIITDKYIKDLADGIDLGVNQEVLELLNKLKEESNE